MTTIGLSSKLDKRVARFASAMVEGVLNACDAGRLVKNGMDMTGFGPRTHVLGFGKASAGMVAACVDQLGDRFAGGVVLCPDEMIPKDRIDDGLCWYGVDHPLPTERNIQATAILAEYARLIPADDDCIVCISGGGSAHLCSPRDGVTIDEIISVTGGLNASGASIHELNAARRSLETLKSGGLAAVLGHVRRCHAVVISDVPGNDLNVIASGPMVSDVYPVVHTIVGDQTTMLKVAGGVIEDHGMKVCSMIAGVGGAGGECGRLLARRLMDNPRGAHLVTGETTVDTEGSAGIGGPCLEMVLSGAVELAERTRTAPGGRDLHFGGGGGVFTLGGGGVFTLGGGGWLVMGLASDGIDGPSMAAGAVITSTMLQGDRLVDARGSLKDHATFGFLDSIGATIMTGPTGTNVNDLGLVCVLGKVLSGGKSGC